VGVDVSVTVDLLDEPPVIELFDLLCHDSKEVRVPSQGSVQPARHREDGPLGRVTRGVEFNKVGHVFEPFSVCEAGDVSIRELFDKLGLDAKAFPNRDSDVDSVPIDNISLWQRRQCFLV